MVSVFHYYDDDDDDDPTLMDSTGVEYGDCIACYDTVPLSTLMWGGVCQLCGADD